MHINQVQDFQPPRKKRVLVAGGASGIGASTATLLASRGYEIAIADLDVAGAKLVADRLDYAQALFLDVTDSASVDSVFQHIQQSWDGLDGLVYCPGVGVSKSFLAIERCDWDRVLAVNLSGAFLCCQNAGRLMAAAGAGSIVAMSSVAAQRPSASTVPYSVSKAALENLIIGFAMELGPSGVRANLIAPGATNTPLVRTLHTGDLRARFTRRIPLGRYAEPDEIAAAASFLISDEATFITGQVLYVDGGMSVVNLLAEEPPSEHQP